MATSNTPAEAPAPPRSALTVGIAKPHPRQRFETFVKAHVERLPGRVELLCGPWLTCDGEGRRVGPPAALRSLARGLGRLIGPAAANALRRGAVAGFLRDRDADVVLAEFGQAGVLVREGCDAAGVPLVVHFHGFDAWRHDIIEHWGGRYRTMFDTAAAVVAVSHPMEEQLVRLGAPREKVRYNPYGVDLDRFATTDPGSNPPVFVAVGRFVAKKAPDATIRAFARVREECADARLVMAGGGPLLAACRELAGGLNTADAVDFPGSVPHGEVARLMAGARALVQHSVQAPDGDCEGMPNSILEAGAAGLPVVATRHAGIPEAVIEGETGLLVDEHDVRGMADHMITLARDAELAARLGTAARGRIAAEFSMEKSIAGLYAILADAAGERR